MPSFSSDSDLMRLPYLSGCDVDEQMPQEINSRYYNVPELAAIKSNAKQLSLLHTNISSISLHRGEIVNLSFFISRLKTNLQILHLHSTVPSMVKKDFRSPSLHYGWHSQLKLIFSTQNKDQNYKTKIDDMTNYRTTEPRQIAGQGKEKKRDFCSFFSVSFFLFSPLFSSSGRFKTRNILVLSHSRNPPQHAEQKQ